MKRQTNNESSNIFFKQNIQPEYNSLNDNTNRSQLNNIKPDNQYLQSNFESIHNKLNPLNELAWTQKSQLLGISNQTATQNKNMLINDEQMLIPEDQIVEIPEEKKQEMKNNDNLSMDNIVIGELEEVQNINQ